MEKKRILGRVVAERLSDQEIEMVAGGASDWRTDKYTHYPTNGGSDDTVVGDH